MSKHYTTKQVREHTMNLLLDKMNSAAMEAPRYPEEYPEDATDSRIVFGMDVVGTAYLDGRGDLFFNTPSGQRYRVRLSAVRGDGTEAVENAPEDAESDSES